MTILDTIELNKRDGLLSNKIMCVSSALLMFKFTFLKEKNEIK